MSGYITITNSSIGGNYFISGTTTGTGNPSITTWGNNNTGTTSTAGITISNNTVTVNAGHLISGELNVQPGTILRLPDGHIIKVDDFGNFEILDDNAQVTYKANNVLEFNKYINGSDLLEAFIGDLGHMGVKQGEVLNVPIELFINWLIFKAAEQDGEDIPNDVPLLEYSVKPTKHPKCLCCGKFIKKKLVEHKIHFCNPEHHHLYLEKIGI